MEGLDWTYEYTFAVCTRCDQPALLERLNTGQGFADDYDFLYPQPLTSGPLLPRGLSRLYRDALKAQKAKAWTATVVVVERALEEIFCQFDGSAHDFDENLQRLLAAGLISQELYDWGTNLYVVRNQGAEAQNQVTAVDARFAVEFLDALILTLYSLHSRFENWAVWSGRSELACHTTSEKQGHVHHL